MVVNALHRSGIGLLDTQYPYTLNYKRFIFRSRIVIYRYDTAIVVLDWHSSDLSETYTHSYSVRSEDIVAIHDR